MLPLLYFHQLLLYGWSLSPHYFTTFSQHYLWRGNYNAIIVIKSHNHTHWLYLKSLFPSASRNYWTATTKAFAYSWKKNHALTCNASGEPLPNITWAKDGIPVDKFNVIGYQLHLMNVKREDVGSYRCTASNGYGDDAASVSIVGIRYKQSFLYYQGCFSDYINAFANWSCFKLGQAQLHFDSWFNFSSTL